MKFYLPFIILLTMLSFNLEAATVTDVLDLPYKMVEPSLLRTESIPAPLDWSGTLFDFQALAPNGLESSTAGTLALVINGNPTTVQQFVGEILPTREFSLVSNIGSGLVVFDGAFTQDYDKALGQVFSLDNSGTTGFFELQAVDLPAAGILFIGAMGYLMVFRHRRSIK